MPCRDLETESDIETSRAECWLVSVCFLCCFVWVCAAWQYCLFIWRAVLTLSPCIYSNPHSLWHLLSLKVRVLSQLQHTERAYCSLHTSLLYILISCDVSLLFSDSGSSSDGSRCGKGESLPAKALEKEPWRAELQISPKDARRSTHHVSRATKAPGPEAEPHHTAWDASVRPTAKKGQGGKEKQEKEEHKVQAHRGDP